MHHEIALDEESRERRSREDSDSTRTPAFALTHVSPDQDFSASIAEDRDWQVPGATVREVERALEEVGLPPSHGTRTIYAVEQVAKRRRESAPFDQLNQFELFFEQLGAAPPPPREKKTTREMSEEEKHATFRALLQKEGGWWIRYGHPKVSIQEFHIACNNAGGIPSGDREHASVEQLQEAARYGARLILGHCRQAGIEPPSFEAWLKDCSP
jgi:hypothetical protein